MGAALGGSDNIDKRFQNGVIPLAPAKSDIDLTDSFDFTGHHSASIIQDRNFFNKISATPNAPDRSYRCVKSQKFYKFCRPPTKVELLRHRVFSTQVIDLKMKSWHKKCRLT